MIMINCIICETPLNGNQKKFCSNKCKQKSHWHTTQNQANTYHSQTIRAYKRKLALIDERGGACQVCGYNVNMAALHFHHRDATQKNFQLDLRTLSNCTMEKILDEFSKCVLLCGNCHSEHHNPEMLIESVRQVVGDNTDVLAVNKVKNVCSDCGTDINSGQLRCKPCNDINKRRVHRPSIEHLYNEFNEFGVTWCAKKYNVNRNTIHRWLKNYTPDSVFVDPQGIEP
jgi:hypothetical protein